MDILVSSNFERLLWYLAYESSGEASDSARRASAGATVDGWMKNMKSNGRVEVPIEVLELARWDFLAERVSNDQVCLVCVFDQMTSLKGDLTSDAPDDKAVLHWEPFVHRRSAYDGGLHGRADSVYPQVRVVPKRELFDLLRFVSSARRLLSKSCFLLPTPPSSRRPLPGRSPNSRPLTSNGTCSLKNFGVCWRRREKS